MSMSREWQKLYIDILLYSVYPFLQIYQQRQLFLSSRPSSWYTVNNEKIIVRHLLVSSFFLTSYVFLNECVCEWVNNLYCKVLRVERWELCSVWNAWLFDLFHIIFQIAKVRTLSTDLKSYSTHIICSSDFTVSVYSGLVNVYLFLLACIPLVTYNFIILFNQ